MDVKMPLALGRRLESGMGCEVWDEVRENMSEERQNR